MPAVSNPGRVTAAVQLALADGQCWLIRPADNESAQAVARLQQVMRLGSGPRGIEIRVAAGGTCTRAFDSASKPGALLCVVPPLLSLDMEVAQMRIVASFVAQASLRRKALLLHGALAEFHGSGIVMAGPGGIGKSTASSRLPSPWRSLSDDATLVVRDEMGHYWAHPWPTWSRFHHGGPGGAWAVEQAVPLHALFFLSQSSYDRLAPVGITQAAAMIIESAARHARIPPRLGGPATSGTLLGDYTNAAWALAMGIPAYSLQLGLEGRFWEEIENVLPARDAPRGGGRSPQSFAPSYFDARADQPAVPTTAGDSQCSVYMGPSMYPILKEGDLLEVRPYGTAQVRRGDVVCFASPVTGTALVRRVVSVGRQETEYERPTQGIRTRGDNDSKDEPWVLQAGDVIGRVVSAQRGARRRVIRGGGQGLFVHAFVHLGRSIGRCFSDLSQKLCTSVACIGPLRRLLTIGFRLRLVWFDARRLVFLKLLSGRQTVGQYDAREERWQIRRPFRLFVDEQTLRKASSFVTDSQPGRTAQGKAAASEIAESASQ